jgi:hypothetical protein
LVESPAREITWDYLKAHWDSLAEKVATFGGRGAVSALAGFCSVEMRDDIQQFASCRVPVRAFPYQVSWISYRTYRGLDATLVHAAIIRSSRAGMDFFNPILERCNMRSIKDKGCWISWLNCRKGSYARVPQMPS